MADLRAERLGNMRNDLRSIDEDLEAVREDLAEFFPGELLDVDQLLLQASTWVSNAETALHDDGSCEAPT